MKNRPSRRLYFVLAFLALGAVFCLLALVHQKQRYLEIDFLDVGQGDAILIKSPSGQRVLIDGGPDNSVLIALAKELPLFDRRLDLVILTHAHDDHLVGLLDVAKRFVVQSFANSITTSTSSNFQFWLKDVNSQKLVTNQSVDLGKAKLNILRAPIVQEKNINNSSLVMKLNYNDFCLILTGDAEIKVEEQIINSKADLHCPVLKLGHHGSDTSSSLEFLRRVQPELAIASVGKNNKFGHPSLRVLKRLERLGIKIKRTDELGTIRLLSDGYGYWLK